MASGAKDRRALANVCLDLRPRRRHARQMPGKHSHMPSAMAGGGCSCQTLNVRIRTTGASCAHVVVDGDAKHPTRSAKLLATSNEAFKAKQGPCEVDHIESAVLAETLLAPSPTKPRNCLEPRKLT